MENEPIEQECPRCGALCLVDDGSYVAIESIPVTRYESDTALPSDAAQALSVDLPERVIDQLFQQAGVSTYHPDGDQREKLYAFARNVVAETLARLPAAPAAPAAAATDICRDAACSLIGTRHQYCMTVAQPDDTVHLLASPANAERLARSIAEFKAAQPDERAAPLDADVRAFLENLAKAGSEPLNSAVGYKDKASRLHFMVEIRNGARALLARAAVPQAENPQ